MTERRPHGWIRAVAAICFAAGMACGLALPRIVDLVRGPRGPIDPDEVFVRELANRYDLSSDQVRSLRMILAAEWMKTKEIIRDKPPPEAAPLRRLTDQRIEALLSAEQCEKYQRDKRIRESGR
jgi:hypothetical protein